VDSQIRTSRQGVGLPDRCRSQSKLYRAMAFLLFPFLVVSVAMRTTLPHSLWTVWPSMTGASAFPFEFEFEFLFNQMSASWWYFRFLLTYDLWHTPSRFRRNVCSSSEHYFPHLVAVIYQSRLLLSFPFPQLSLPNVVHRLGWDCDVNRDPPPSLLIIISGSVCLATGGLRGSTVCRDDEAISWSTWVWLSCIVDSRVSGVVICRISRSDNASSLLGSIWRIPPAPFLNPLSMWLTHLLPPLMPAVVVWAGGLIGVCLTSSPRSTLPSVALLTTRGPTLVWYQLCRLPGPR